MTSSSQRRLDHTQDNHSPWHPTGCRGPWSPCVCPNLLFHGLHTHVTTCVRSTAYSVLRWLHCVETNSHTPALSSGPPASVLRPPDVRALAWPVIGLSYAPSLRSLPKVKRRSVWSPTGARRTPSCGQGKPLVTVLMHSQSLHLAPLPTDWLSVGKSDCVALPRAQVFSWHPRSTRSAASSPWH